MANQSSRGRGPERRPMPGRELDRHVSQCCYDLGINFPPNPAEAWPRMMYFKDCGQVCLNTNHYACALNNYTLALQVAELFPEQPQFRDEAVKILCNRSLVFFQMLHYQDALNDATAAVAFGPTFLKGYWRACQAAKMRQDDPHFALPFVCKGLKIAMGVGGTSQDVISFLTEFCTLVQNMPNSRDPMLDDLMVPVISDIQIWTKTLKTLVGNKCWDSLMMLVLGNSGPVCWLRGFCKNFNFSGFDISRLLNVSYIDLKIWGISLVEKFLELGASLEKIEDKFGMPALHVGTDLAVKTEAILHRYKDIPNAINITNSKGQTALHQAVLSGQDYQPVGERIIETLLKHHCDPNLRDKEGKLPIDYVMQGTNVFMLLKKTQSVADLKKELEAVKQRGNEAFKRRDTSEALRLYEEAFDISKQSKELYKEAAVVYSNRANVFYTLKDFEKALTNALAAVNSDPTYQKGHLWKGKILCQMGAIPVGFLAYVDGFIQSVGNLEEKLCFITEAVMQLLQLQESKLVSCYDQLRRIKESDVWTLALQKFSSNGEWQCIIYLLLGPNLDLKQFKTCPTVNEVRNVSSGVACNSPRDCLDLKTVFAYLHRKPYSHGDFYWLDVLLLSIYVVVNRAAFNKFAENERDNYLHAAARFALFTERFFLLETILKQPLDAMKDQIINVHGESVYHTITKIVPLPSEKTLVKVTQMFMTKGLSNMVKNGNGKLAVDYLDKSYSGKVFDLFFKKVVSFSWGEVNLVKDQGNLKYKLGDIQEAVELYTKAIDMLQSQSMNQLKGSASKDVSFLYGNRAEGYLKLRQYDCALDDAKMCVSYNRHWHKAHLRVAQALKGLKKMDSSLNAYITAYKDVEASMDDKVRIEILSEMTLIYLQMAPKTFDAKIHNNFAKGQGHVWLKTSYELIRKDDWDRAYIAYVHIMSERKKMPHITYTLAPICKLEKMRAHPWSADLIQHLLDCGADKRTLTLNKGDTYLHAAVRICLLVAKNGLLLKWLLKRYKEVNLFDKDGNSPLHTAAKERGITTETRYNIIIVLLKANVDANVKNGRGELAIDLIPGQETDLMEKLRMAMFKGKTMKQDPSFESQQGQRTQVQEKTILPKKPTQSLKQNCEECRDLLRDARNFFDNDNATDGYIKLSEIFNKQHKTDTHKGIVNKSVAAIVEKVGEKSVPEIPSSLTGIPKEFYQLVVDGLIVKQKWQQLNQLNSIVRTYRLVKNQDQLEEAVTKGLKRLDSNLEKMQGYFKKTMQIIPDAFTAPTEADEMFKKLNESKRLYVVGPHSSLYIQTTLHVIKGSGIDINRCVEMTECSDWKDVNSDDVDLVLFRDPFGIRQITSERTIQTLDCLDSIDKEIGRVPLKERMFVIITSDYDVHLQYMNKCCQEPHDILTDVVLFQAPTTEKDPHVVIDDCSALTIGKTEYGVLKTLQEHTKVYIDYNTSQGFYAQRFEEAKKILREHKMLAISGPRYSGKTSLATKLMGLYSSDRRVLLQRPNDMRYIRLEDLSIVLVEDFAGKFEPNKQGAIEWYGVFDVLLPAVLSGKLSVIIVSEAESFRRCKLPTHGLLRYDIALASLELPVIKPEPRLDLATGGAGGGGSLGDDSSSKSDSESLPKHENRKTSHRKMHRIKNIKQYDDAITENDEEAIRELLKAGNLPNSRQIRDAIQVFGRESGAMTRICRDVSRRILNRDDHIVRVEPAYEFPDEDDVTFIVYLKQPQTDLNFADLEFKVVKRVIGQYSSEGKDIVDREVNKNLQFTLEEAKELRTCLAKYSKPLMEKHSNLQMISASHFKSKNYGNENLKKTMCVVLYVRVKGCIPLTEEILPNKLDEIPTDIREGGFEFLSHAGERHAHLKMGCEIIGSKFCGTIGPFLKHEGNTYCLTAAHVLVGPPVDNTTLPSMTSAGQDPIHVYQPNPARSKSELKHTPFGSVHCVKYSKGGGDVPGIDAAAILIQDERRLPISGEFPESAIIEEDDSHMEVEVDENAVQNLKYISGKVCDRNFFDDKHGVEILKFGAVTGATRGLLHVVGTSVRYANVVTEYDDKWELYSQIEITKSVEGKKFADHGDSGAVVLVSFDGSRNDLRALGLLIGQSSTGTVLATPMHAILEEFGLTDSHVMAFQERNVGPLISVDSGFGQAPSTAHADIQRQSEETFLKARFESIEKAVTDNKNETSAIRSQVDSTKKETSAIRSKVDATKNETSAIRSQVDATKNETSAIRSQVDALSTNFVSFNTNFESFADKMFQMMPNHKSNASDKNQNSGT